MNIGTHAMFTRIPVRHQHTWSAGEECAELLNQAPYNKLVQQEKQVDKVQLEEVNTDTCAAVANSSEGFLSISIDSCTCIFWKGMGLPCHHILALRRYLKVNEFDSSLCLSRWTRQNLKQQVDTTSTDAPCQLNVTRPPRRRQKRTVMAEPDKFTHAAKCTSQLTKVLARTPTNDFFYRCQVIERLSEIWSRGGIATLTEVVETDSKCNICMNNIYAYI